MGAVCGVQVDDERSGCQCSLDYRSTDLLYSRFDISKLALLGDRPELDDGMLLGTGWMRNRDICHLPIVRLTLQ